MPQPSSIPSWADTAPKRMGVDAPLPLALCWAIWIGAALILWAAILTAFAG